MKRRFQFVYMSLCVFVLLCSAKFAKAETIATEIQVNTTHIGNLGSANEIDLYSFTTTENGIISLNFKSDLPKKDAWKITLMDSNKAPIAEFFSTDSVIKTSDYGFAAGTYYVRILSPYPSLYYSEANYEIIANFTTSKDYESEYNNDYKTANVIEVNKKYNANLYKSTDVDWYTFTTTKDGYVNLEFSNEYSGVSSWKAILYDNNRVPIYTIFNGEISKTTANIGLPPGNYYVSVECSYPSLYYSRNTYQIKVNATASSTYETEGNSEFATADIIPVNKEFTGNLFKSSDEDYYKFTTTANGYFSVSLRHEYLDSSSYTVTIYKEDKTPIYTFDNGDTKASSIYLGLSKGTYYIGIKGKFTALYYTDAEYHLKVTYKKSNAWESESNDTIKSADTIALKTAKGIASGAINGNILSYKDIDYYKMKVEKKGKLTLTFSHDDVNGVVYKISVFDNKNKVVATILNESAKSSQTLNVAKGTYYVKVECSSYAFSNTKYTVKVSLK